MPWNQTSPMNERTLFVADVLRSVQTFSDVCAQYNISRTTGYKWLDRHREEGPAGLHERSRRPLSCPTQTPAPVVEAIVQARQRHPKWGPKKLARILSSKDPALELPARSTISNILNRQGLIAKVRRHSAPGHPGKPIQNMDAPNATWCTDFKGHFRTGDGIYCYPLTTTDACSRFLLGCKALYTTAHDDAKPVFQRLFEEFGLPDHMRSDNGVPFATTGLARLSRLSVWWIRLGITPELIEPGKPQQNGRHERMHRTLKAETARPPAASLRAQQKRFDHFRCEFNSQRPHEALGQETPASRYTPSPRPFPRKLPPIEYPAHFERRRVSANACIRWRDQYVSIGTCLIGEDLGLEEFDDGAWNVYFAHVRIGRLIEEHMRILDLFGKLTRINV